MDKPQRAASQRPGGIPQGMPMRVAGQPAAQPLPPELTEYINRARNSNGRCMIAVWVSPGDDPACKDLDFHASRMPGMPYDAMLRCFSMFKNFMLNEDPLMEYKNAGTKPMEGNGSAQTGDTSVDSEAVG